MNSRSILSIFLLFFIITINQAQSNYPQEYFRPPVDGRVYLSGTFGELRSNHFHAGIDIKTGGVEGKNVYASADGWVSRIKISPWGYGNALYIEHPNGYTTVYGHLKELKGEIAKYLKEQQYQKQKFAVDLYLKKGQFKVNKSDIIALSGNTGGSGGPHVHFEIRETATQEPINPLLFGIKVKDLITPLIRSIRIYPAQNNSQIEQKTKAVSYSLKGWGKNYTLKTRDTIQIEGDFYLGINTVDKQNDSHNSNGVYQIELWIDSNLFYKHNVERLNFSTNRYINTLIDYAAYKKLKSRYQRTYISPNNPLVIYQEINNKGIISFKDEKYHKIQYVVKDVKGNTSILNFIVLSAIPDSKDYQSKLENNLFDPLVQNSFNNESINITFPKKALYDTLTFTFSIKEKHPDALSSTYSIGTEKTALQKNLSIELKNISAPTHLKDKIYVGKIDEDNINANNSGKWNSNSFSFKTRNFGDYALFADTIKPNIKLKTKLTPNKKPQSLDFIVKDKESGINNYDAWVNGKWVILQYDPKSFRMILPLNFKLQNENNLKITVTDNVGNRKTKNITF